MDEAAGRPGGRVLREGPLLAAWAVFTAVLAALVLVRAEQRAVDDPVQKAARGEVTGLAALSLVRAPRLERSMALIAGRYADAQLTQLRLDPTSVRAAVRTPDFKTHDVSVDTALKLSVDGQGEGVQKGLRPAAVVASGPERMLRAVNASTGTTPGDLDYIVLIDLSGAPRWELFLARGARPDQRTYVATPDGAVVWRSGRPEPAAAAQGHSR